MQRALVNAHTCGEVAQFPSDRRFSARQRKRKGNTFKNKRSLKIKRGKKGGGGGRTVDDFVESADALRLGASGRPSAHARSQVSMPRPSPVSIGGTFFLRIPGEVLPRRLLGAPPLPATPVRLFPPAIRNPPRSRMLRNAATERRCLTVSLLTAVAGCQIASLFHIVSPNNN